MNELGYLAYFKGRKIEIRDAADKWDAVQKARERLFVAKANQGLLAVELAEKDGEAVKGWIE